MEEERSSGKNSREEINFSCTFNDSVKSTFIWEKYDDLNPSKLIHLCGTWQNQVYFKIVSPLAFLWENMLGSL